MICSKCGCRVELGMKKCPVCGSILDNEYTRYEKKMKKKRIQKKAVGFLFLVSDIIRTLIGVGIALFGCVGMMEGDYLFAASIILFGLSLIPYWYKKASNKFIAIILPILFVLLGVLVLLFTID
ncbi:MAG: hypothetical protein UDR60_05660 [Catenibacterium mitsuokai]|nr:hypothetical protein [Catenibacterium mitsuokai]MEE0334392.1 hypothetical protein [Catenibacterium mitsuokai]